jgi:serine/threonine protein kinase
MTLDIAQLIAGRFRVDAFVGEGGMGTVYSATDEVLGRRVAIKLLKSELAADGQFLERFAREAKIIAQLSLNPHVVTIYDVGQTDHAVPFLVTEFLTGHPLSDELTGPYRPSRSWTLEVGIQICQALADAHGRDVVHRDLKPANVFVVRTGVVPLFIKVLDFGLSRSGQDPLSVEHATQAGTIQGTPRYISPEAIAGEGAQCASDIYSLGVMLYEFATRRHPYEARSSAEFLRAHLAAEPMPFPEEAVPLPAALRTLVRQMLEKDPCRRPDARTCVRELSRISLASFRQGESAS